MRTRSLAFGVLAAAALTFGVTGTASAAIDRDCPDFASQADAQAAFDAVPGDPERLDGNDDGQACESYGYPAGTARSTGAGAAPQVANRPTGGVAAGDGSSGDASVWPHVLGGLAVVGAGGAAVASRRSARVTV